MSLQNNGEVKKRIDFIDYAKFIGIFLLLIEHTGNFIDISGNASYIYLKKWICSFHMPIFFIVYGYVSGLKVLELKDWKEYILKQIKSLLVPYLLWAMVYSNNYGANFFLGIAYGTNASLGYAQTNQVLWFLPTMFISTLLYQLVLNFLKRAKNNIVLIILVITIGIFVASISTKVQGLRLPFGIDISFLGLSFMLIGNFLIKPTMKYIETLNKIKAGWILIFMCSLIIGIFISIYNAPVNKTYWVTVMAVGEYGKNVVLFFDGAIINSIAILLICNHIKNNVLLYLGQHTLIIMGVHYILFPFTLHITVEILRNINYSVLIAILNSLFTIILCIPISYLVDKFCPCLNGK